MAESINEKIFVPKKKFFTKKKIVWTTIIVVVVGFIGYQIYKPKNNSANIQTDTVKKQNLKLTVLATGQVVSSTDLDLSFKASGVVSQIYVKEGDKVKAGQSLAALDQKDALAALTTAQGALAQAKANYEKVLAGASNQDITIAQVALDTATTNLKNTKSQQATAVANARNALFNSTLSAIPAQNNTGASTVSISGAYTGTDQGIYTLSIVSSGNGLVFQTTGLENSGGLVKSTPIALGTKGLYIQFTGTPNSGDTWTIPIPNTLAINYVTNYNSYQAALQASQVANRLSAGPGS